MLEVTCVPALLARSKKSTANAITPFASEDVSALAALQDVPEPDTVALVPPIVAVGGSWISSLEVNVTVITSPTLARVLTELLELIETADRVGAVRSKVRELL